MGLKSHLKPLERQKIITQRECGIPLREIQANSGRSLSTIRGTLKKAKTRDVVDQKDLPRAGAPRKFTRQAAQRWRRRIQRDPSITYKHIGEMEGCQRRAIYNRMREVEGNEPKRSAGPKKKRKGAEKSSSHDVNAQA
ncbi:MAG: hypothetical protein Q9167_002282 [Letrouitia subvulpina]